jgi:hypothetical protein
VRSARVGFGWHLLLCMSMDVYACPALCCLAMCCLLPRPMPKGFMFHAHVPCRHGFMLMCHVHFSRIRVCMGGGGDVRIRSWRHCRASSAHGARGGSRPLQDVRWLLLQLPDGRYVRACKYHSMAPSVHPSIRPLLNTLFSVASTEIRATVSTICAVLFSRSSQI